MGRPARAAAALSLGVAAAAGGRAAGAQAAPPAAEPAIARWVPAAPDPRHVFVLDSAHLLSAGAVRALQDSSRALQAETGADVVWVTLPSLGGRPIEEAALYAGRRWRAASKGALGDPAANRGLVVLYVPDKGAVSGGRNFRVEVARGLEGTITDARSRRIAAAMRDSLRATRYDGAYAAGFAAAAALVRQDAADRLRHAEVAAAAPTVVPSTASAPAATDASGTRVVLVALLVAAALVGLLVVVTRWLGSRLPAGAAGPRTMRVGRTAGGNGTPDALSTLAMLSAFDDEPHRRSTFDFGSSSSDAGSFGGSDGGSTGGGDGYSGGGSSDSI